MGFRIGFGIPTKAGKDIGPMCTNEELQEGTLHARQRVYNAEQDHGTPLSKLKQQEIDQQLIDHRCRSRQNLSGFSLRRLASFLDQKETREDSSRLMTIAI